MKRKLFLLLAAICSAVNVFPNAPWNIVDVEIDGIFYRLFGEFGTATVSSKGYWTGVEYSGDVVIPSSVEYEKMDFQITEIGYQSFLNNAGVTSVSIPEGVTYIALEAFEGCTGLQSVTFRGGSNLQTIYNVAFGGCTNLKSFSIPNSVETIGIGTFSGCSSLTSIHIPSNVKEIGRAAFAYCDKLSNVTIDNGVTSIGETAFSNDTSLTSITIPNSVTSMGDKAFYNCTNLTTVIWNAEHCELNYHPDLFNETNVTSFTFGENVDTIPIRLCKGLDKITSIIIPNSARFIAEYAFENCSALTSVVIGKNVTSMGAYVFSGCKNLTSVVWNANNFTNRLWNIQRPSNWVFGGSTNITSFTFGDEIETIPDGLCYELKLTSITIPNSVKHIGEGAFYNCTGLTSINIPSSVTSIGDDTFKGCNSLTSVHISDLASWCNIDFEDNPLTYAKHLFLNNAEISEIAIPEGVTTIKKYVFEECQSLTSVSIPNSVKVIEKYAFYYCENLSLIQFGDSLESIGDDAFSSCKSLTTLTLPKTLLSIGEYAFDWCDKLNSVISLATTPPSTPSNTYYNPFSTRNKNKILYVPAESVDLYKGSTNWTKEFNPIIPIQMQANDTSTSEFTATLVDTCITLSWPAIENAAAYTIEIKDNSGDIVYTLIFNNQGQLQSMRLAAPARDGSNKATSAMQSTEGWQYIINYLDTSKQYTYTITVRNSEGEALYTKTVTNSTPTAIDKNTIRDEKSTKILRNGQILIQKNDKTYTITGQEVR